MGWEKIKGQNKIVNLMRHAIERNRIAHSYLFSGAEGVGKKLVAQTLAQVLNCVEQDTDSCGNCSGCHKTENWLHPDVVLIEPEESGNLKIEKIRQIQEKVYYKPFEGRYKVWIIDQADRMTLQAANCLLKTLEEPPASTLLILITSQPDSLLPTIISRCQQVNFARLIPEVLERLLQEQGMSPEFVKLGMALSDGGLSRVNQTQLEEFWAWREEVMGFLQGEQGQFVDIFALGDKLAKNKDQIEKLVQLFSFWYRDLLLLKLGLDTSLLINQDKCIQLNQQVEGLSLSVIQQRLGLIQEAFNTLQYNVNPRLLVENVLFKLNIKEEPRNEITSKRN